MSNPFDDPDATYLVLVNSETQYSLWPMSVDQPPGWTSVFQGNRQACLDYINENWIDMRPRSLIEAMKQ